MRPSIKTVDHSTNDLNTLYQLPLSLEMQNQLDLTRKERVSTAWVKRHHGLGTIDWQSIDKSLKSASFVSNILNDNGGISPDCCFMCRDF